MIKTINCQVIPVAGYVMNVCNLEENDLGEMDMIMKSVLRRKGFQEDKPWEIIFNKKESWQRIKKFQICLWWNKN